MWTIEVMIGSQWHVLTGVWERLDECQTWANDHVPSGLVYEIKPVYLN